MRRIGWIVIAALCLVVPGFAQDDKLDPDAASGGAPPFNEDALETYSPSMLVAFLEVYQNLPGATAAATAAKISNYLSKIDPNWKRPEPPAPSTSGTTPRPRGLRSRNDRPAPGGSGTGTGATATATGSGSGSGADADKDDTAPPSTNPPRPTTPPPTTPPEATPPPTPTERARTEPPPPTATATGEGARTPPRTRWFEEAQQQMQEYWVADTGTGGALPRGSIFDPRTGKVVKLEEYIQREGLAEGIDAEIANSGTGMGTQKRIKDQ